jgi:hypothetical protein
VKKIGEDDFPSNSSMISPDENLVVTTSWRFSMIATELMLGWAVFFATQGDLTEIKTHGHPG